MRLVEVALLDAFLELVLESPAICAQIVAGVRAALHPAGLFGVFLAEIAQE